MWKPFTAPRLYQNRWPNHLAQGCSLLTPDLEDWEYSLGYIKLRETVLEQRYAADVCAEKKQLSYALFPTIATLDSTVGNNDYLVKNPGARPGAFCHLHPPSRAETSRHRRSARWASPGHPAPGSSGLCHPCRKFQFWGYLCSNLSNKDSWRKRKWKGKRNNEDVWEKVHLKTLKQNLW